MARSGLSTERVVAAGAELADEIGYEAVTAAALARQLGVQTASLYSHVDSTADLKSGITALALNELADEVAAAIGGRSRSDALAGMAEAYRNFARQHPGRFAATLSVNRVDDRVLAAGRRHSELSEAILRGYSIEAGAIGHAIRFVGSALGGFANIEQRGGFRHSQPSSLESWQYAVAALDIALSNWPALPHSAGPLTPDHPDS